MVNLITLEDGRTFPQYDGKALPWDIGSQFTHQDQQDGYPRMRAIIAACALHRPEYLERERRDLVRAGFDRMFGHNARKLLALVESAVESVII